MNVIETFDQLITLPSLHSLEADSASWIWPSFIAQEAFHIISGEPGSMKSMLMLSFAIGLSQGKLWDTEIAAKPVIYVDRENPLSLVKHRALTLGLSEQEPNFKYWGLWNECEPPMLGDPMYLKLAAFLKPVMIFDSLIRFHKGDENDAKEMALATTHLRELAAAGATVILLHHKGKPNFEGTTSPYRGSSEIAGACDIGHSIVKRKDQHGTLLVIKSFKNRFEEEKELSFHFDDTSKQFIPNELPILNRDEQHLLQTVIETPGKRANILAGLTRFSETKTNAILKGWEGRLFESQIGPGNSKLWFPLESRG